MAKSKKPKSRSEPTYEGLTREELARSLDLDLDREACFEELFGELLDEPRPRGPVRVTQMGPGRRRTPRDEE